MRELQAQRAIQRAEVVENWGGIGSRRARSRVQSRCQLCGFSEIRTDEVVDRGVIFLAECPRCEHRWTSPEPILSAPPRSEPLVKVSLQRVPAKGAQEVLPAA